MVAFGLWLQCIALTYPWWKSQLNDHVSGWLDHHCWIKALRHPEMWHVPQEIVPFSCGALNKKSWENRKIIQSKSWMISFLWWNLWWTYGFPYETGDPPWRTPHGLGLSSGRRSLEGGDDGDAGRKQPWFPKENITYKRWVKLIKPTSMWKSTGGYMYWWFIFGVSQPKKLGTYQPTNRTACDFYQGKTVLVLVISWGYSGHMWESQCHWHPAFGNGLSQPEEW